MNRELTLKIRRELHQIPEPSLKEFKTIKYIENFLKSLNIEYRYVTQTGIVAFIKGKNNFKIGLRADIDALEITENTKLKFSSRHKGYMHACGHDFHMANLLSIAKHYSEVQPQASLILIFQPAEEGAGGAKLLLKNGLWDFFGKPDVIFGYHVKPDLETGIISAACGKAWAGTSSFEIIFQGQGGHGANPDKTQDLIMIFSQWYQHIQSFISRKINTFESIVLTVGDIKGADRLNIIPNKLKIKGMLRYFNNKTRDFVIEQMKTSAQNLSELYNAKSETKILRDAIPLFNDENLLKNIKKFYKPDNSDYLPLLKDENPVMLAEDFPEYLREAKGVFFFLGAQKDKPRQLHTSELDLNENALFYGINFMINLIDNFKLWSENL